MTTDDTADPAAEIPASWREAEQAATPGDWRPRTVEARAGWGTKPYLVTRVEADAAGSGGIGIVAKPEDAAFTATARSAIPLLLAAADAALSQHRRSLSPASGAGSGDAHGRYYCAGARVVSIGHETVYATWPCLPYLRLLAALTSTTVAEITGRASCPSIGRPA